MGFFTGNVEIILLELQIGLSLVDELKIISLEGLQLFVNSRLLLAVNQAFVFIFSRCSSNVCIQFLLLQMQILFSLRKLPPDRINHDFLFFQNRQQRCLLAKGPLYFLCLPFTLQLNLGQVILEALDLESKLIIFCLEDSPMVPFFFYILSVFDQKLIFLYL